MPVPAFAGAAIKSSPLITRRIFLTTNPVREQIRPHPHGRIRPISTEPQLRLSPSPHLGSKHENSLPIQRIKVYTLEKQLFLQLLLCYDLSLKESDGRFELQLKPVLLSVYCQILLLYINSFLKTASQIFLYKLRKT